MSAEAVLGLVLRAEVPALASCRARLPHVVEEPRGDELDVGLGALALEEALELVVAVALGRHRPELADDADLRLRRCVRSTFTASKSGLHFQSASMMFVRVLERVVDDLLRLLDRAVGVARVHLVGADAVAERVEHVAGDERLHDAPRRTSGSARGPTPRRSPASGRPSAGRGTTRKPSKPASRSALRYSVTYMPKRHGPHAPAVRKTYLLTISFGGHAVLVAQRA